MTCPYCKIEPENIIYRDKKIIAFLPKKSSTRGHIKVVPVSHIESFESMPDEDLTHMFLIANKLSALAFDALHAHGTNIIENFDEPHFCIDIIPRKENDQLNFDWPPQKYSEEDLEGFELLLKDGLKEKDLPKENSKEKPKKENKKEEKDDIDSIEEIEGEDNYLIKQLERIP